MNIILDIDGTLWNTTEVVAKAWNEAVKEANIDELNSLHITSDILKKEFGKPMDVIADDLFGDIDPDKKAKLLEQCCIKEHKAIEDNEEDLTYEGVRETLRSLSADNKLFIVSNCQTGYIELVMAKNCIEDIISDYECFGNTLLSKGENIKLLMNRNGIEIENAIYVGDTMGDFEASKEAGVKFVFATYGFGQVNEPDFTINSFGELMSKVFR